MHNEWDSLYKDSVCHKCKNHGHLAKMCKKSSGGSRSSEGEEPAVPLCMAEEVGSVKGVCQPPTQVFMNVDGWM